MACEPEIVSPPRSAREREAMENWSSRRIRELTPEIALRGMAANKIGCARISMMVRSTSSKARPDTLVQDRTPGSPFSLATHGGSIHFGGEADMHGRVASLVSTLLTRTGHRRIEIPRCTGPTPPGGVV